MTITKSFTRSNGSRRGEQGFTLLEVMVALGIFSVGIVTLLVIRGNCLTEAKLADQLNRASYLAANQMEEFIFGYTYAEDGDRGDFEEEGGEVFPGFWWEVEVVDEEWGESLDEEEESQAAGLGGGLAGETSPAGLSGDDSVNSFIELLKRLEAGGRGSSGGGGASSGGGGGGLAGIFGGTAGGGLEILQKITLTIHFPVASEEESLTVVTYVPIPDWVADDEDLLEEREKVREKYKEEKEREEKRGSRSSRGSKELGYLR